MSTHRNLYNGDCSFLFQDAARYNDGRAPVSAADMQVVIRRFIHLLADNGVDTFVLNPNTQIAYYPSKVVPTAFEGYRRGDREFFRSYGRCLNIQPDMMDAFLDNYVTFMNRYVDLIHAGIDWIAEAAKCCRECGISPWLSIRMIDIHGSHDPENSYDSCPLYRDKRYRLHYHDEHIRLENHFLHPPEGRWDTFIGLNFELPEVRDYMFTMIRELINDYDFEGIELDWLRSPICCHPNASKQTIQTITDWITSMHALARAKTTKTGRPYPFGLRVPANLDACRSIGLDVRAMARADLLDFVGLSNFWDTAWAVPYDRIRRELGHRAKLYAVIERRATQHKANPPAAEPRDALMRGSAASNLVLGVDGIEQFNFFCADGDADYPALRRLDDLEYLRGKPKQYAVPTALKQVRVPPFESHEELPVVLEPHSQRVFPVSMCAEPENTLMELIIQIVIEKQSEPTNHESRITNHDLGVSINGSWPAFDGVPSQELHFPVGDYVADASVYQAINFRRDITTVRDGWNDIAAHAGHQTVRIVSIEILVR